MSYAIDDLRIGVLELFGDVARMQLYPVDFNELPARAGRWDRLRPDAASAEAQRAQRREYQKRMRAADRERRRAYRALCALSLLPSPCLVPGRTASVPWPHYICPRCSSTTPTHRCPG